MNHLIVFGHPNTHSFNGTLLHIVERELTNRGDQFITKNLYQMNFNPLLTMDDFIKMRKGTVAPEVAIEQGDVDWADNIIFIFPIWWNGAPAIVKGWIDRVFTGGFAYAPQADGTIRGLLTGKRAIILSTAGNNEEEMEKTGAIKALETTFIKNIFQFCGIQEVIYKTMYALPSSTDEERNFMLNEVENLIKSLQ